MRQKIIFTLFIVCMVLWAAPDSKAVAFARAFTLGLMIVAILEDIWR